MNIAGGIVVFIMIWWTVLFAILPWGNRQPEQAEAGMAHGAPANPNIMRKFMVTTVITILLWWLVYALMEYKVIDFREAAREMEASFTTDTE